MDEHRIINGFELDDYGWIIRYDTTAEELIIPEGVRGIYWKAIENPEIVKSMVLPGSWHCSHYCLDYFVNLEKIVLSEGIEEIEPLTLEESANSPGMLYNCKALKYVKIPKSIKYIYKKTFCDCPAIDWQDGIGYIGEWAVLVDENAKNYKIREGTTGVANCLFFNGYNNWADEAIHLQNVNPTVETITIPASLTSFWPSISFAYCKEIIVDDNNPCYSSENGVLYNKDKTKLLTYPIMKEDEVFHIPEGVITVEKGAFSYCKKLKELVFPDSIKYIEKRALPYSDSINTVHIPDSLSNIGEDAFQIKTFCGIFGSITKKRTANRMVIYLRKNDVEIPFLLKDNLVDKYQEKLLNTFLILNEEEREKILPLFKTKDYKYGLACFMAKAYPDNEFFKSFYEKNKKRIDEYMSQFNA